MIPAQFDYKAPDTLETAVKLLQENQNSHILGGGYRLVAEMMQGHLAPSLLVDLRNLADLQGIQSSSHGGIEIGSRTTYSAIASSSDIQNNYSALAEAAESIGDPQIRNWETLADLIAYRDLASDLLGAALVLEATVKVVGAEGISTLNVPEFIQRNQTKQWQSQDILTRLELPAPPSNSASAYEVIKHPASRYSICGIAAFVQLSEANSCRVAVTGATPYPIRLSELEAELAGKDFTAENIAIAAQRAKESVAQTENSHGQTILNSNRYASADYRAHLMGVLAERAIEQAVAKARGII